MIAWLRPLGLLLLLLLLVVAVEDPSRLDVLKLGLPDLDLSWIGPPRPRSAQHSRTGASWTLAGSARVIDGDTIVLQGQRVRLLGIDAPESDQTCQDRRGESWPCGEHAAAALKHRIGWWSTVRCEGSAYDRYDRLLARCYQGHEDLNRWMVLNGWALAYRQYASDYGADEDLARSAGIGVWRGSFAVPGDWRRTR